MRQGQAGRSMPKLSPESCTRCGLCETVCPYRLLVRGADGLPVLQEGWLTRCLGCGHCAAVCPAGGVGMAGTATEPLPMAPTEGQVMSGLMRRRSVRRYQQREVSRDVIARALEAARWAPRGHNARRLGCVALTSAEQRSRLTKEIVSAYRWLGRVLGSRVWRTAMVIWVGPGRVRELRAALPGLRWAEKQFNQGGDPLFHHAPVVLLFHAPPDETAEADCALAAGQLSLFAPTLELGTCHIGYASALLKRLPKLARRFGVPRGHRVFAVLTLGYPAVPWRGLPPRPALPVRWR